MHPHSYPSPPRLVASGGPVSSALRIMQDANPSHPRLRDFRRLLARRIEADIALLDALAGDPDLEDDCDDEDGHDAEGGTDDNGVADFNGIGEQGFCGYPGSL